MKKLNVSQMENLKGGDGTETDRWKWNNCQMAAAVGCTLVGVTAGIVSGGLGTALGFACSVAAAGSDVCNGKP